MSVCLFGCLPGRPKIIIIIIIMFFFHFAKPFPNEKVDDIICKALILVHNTNTDNMTVYFYIILLYFVVLCYCKVSPPCSLECSLCWPSSYCWQPTATDGKITLQRHIMRRLHRSRLCYFTFTNNIIIVITTSMITCY